MSRRGRPGAQVPEDDDGSQRLDKWLWAARFFKTRALAVDAIGGGKIEVNGDRPKRARALQVGDEVRVRLGPYQHVVRVRAHSPRRGPAAEAALLYEETPESRQARERLSVQLKAVHPAFRGDEGKPSKKDRRDIERLRREREGG